MHTNFFNFINKTFILISNAVKHSFATTAPKSDIFNLAYFYS
jgi:hypothetical protein